MEHDVLGELSRLLAQAGLGDEQDGGLSPRSQNPDNCDTSQGKSEQDEAFGQQSQSPDNCATSRKRTHEGKVDLSKRPYAKKMKVTHTEQVENRGVDKLPRSKSAGL